jgi:hypothetical protein
MPWFVEAFPNHGVDEISQWMMVPQGGSNLVMLSGGAALTLRYDRLG